ncbi:major facilitator superfamily domain-containing protein [Leptodontidium sp. 2 PMI_412]|nr:major facilitator superfamily domain-containing protein [Leptodontidium sp. 2 PMI_412]
MTSTPRSSFLALTDIVVEQPVAQPVGQDEASSSTNIVAETPIPEDPTQNTCLQQPADTNVAKAIRKEKHSSLETVSQSTSDTDLKIEVPTYEVHTPNAHVQQPVHTHINTDVTHFGTQTPNTLIISAIDRDFWRGVRYENSRPTTLFQSPNETDAEVHENKFDPPFQSPLRTHVQSASDTDAEAQAPMGNDESTPASQLVHHWHGEPHTLLREIALVGIICIAQIMALAGLGQVIAPLHIIGDSFGTKNPGQLAWFPAAYSLTVGTFILIAGRLGDMYGHKKLFIAGFLWFGVFSLLAGFTVYYPSATILFDTCRALQGIGPSFIMPNALAILGQTYHHSPNKNMVFSLFGAAAPAGFVLGATFGSLFAQVAWWPWAFWDMGAVCFALAIGGLFAIPSMPTPQVDNSDGHSSFVRSDGLGAITGISALVLINLAWNQGPVVGWGTAYTYFILIIGFVALAFFAYVESKAKFPLLPRSALTSDTAFVLVCVGLGWGSFGIWVFYMWEFMEMLRGETPLMASAYFAPAVVSGFCAALTTGRILHKVGPSVVMLIAMLAFTVGEVLAVIAPVGQTYFAFTFVSILIMPWGMDMSFPAATILLSNHMGMQHQGVAASLVNTVVNYSISIVLGIAGTIESRVNKKGEDVLAGYRGAWYLSVGMSGFGVFVAFVFLMVHLRDRKRQSRMF